MIDDHRSTKIHVYSWNWGAFDLYMYMYMCIHVHVHTSAEESLDRFEEWCYIKHESIHVYMWLLKPHQKENVLLIAVLCHSSALK